MSKADNKTLTSLSVLLIGATGSIGGAVKTVLHERGHQVTCLARSTHSENQLTAEGFNVLRGDITRPAEWIDAVSDFDCVIPVATTWGDDMDSVDAALTQALLKALSTSTANKILIYTSGCWAYGSTGDAVATEASPHQPHNGISWSPPIASVVQHHSGVKGMVILPAMVFERDGGVLEPLLSEVKTSKRIQIIGSKKIRWPLVHREDLAVLYCLMMEQGTQGAIYNAASIDGVTTGEIARHLSQRFGLTDSPDIISVEQAVADYGMWAAGYVIDQQMSSQIAMDELGWVPTRVDLAREIS